VHWKSQEAGRVSTVLHLKEIEKEQTKPKASRKKEIIKIRAEINETETKNNHNGIDQ